MVSYNKRQLRQIHLLPKEQEAVLRHCRFTDNNLYTKIMNAPDGIIVLLDFEIANLRRSIDEQIPFQTDSEVKSTLCIISNKLSPNKVITSLAEKMVDEYENMEQLQDLVNNEMNKGNAIPDPEMCDLSPLQVHDLIYLTWEEEQFPIKFNENLSCNDLKNSVFFNNTRILLNTLAAMKGQATATAAKGNLNRKVVKTVCEKMYLNPWHNKLIQAVGAKNETDIKPLHMIRLVCKHAGLIRKSKNKWLVTGHANFLRTDENVGKLFRLLFLTYFRKLNIGYFDRHGEFDSIQQTMGYSLHVLNRKTVGSVKMEKLTREIFLPAVLDEINDDISKPKRLGHLAHLRVIEPLEAFGLLECEWEEDKFTLPQIVVVKKTGLFDKFMRFKF
ncbi:hypothetical protein ACFL3G_10270 [Planctomycetota bacterium]